MKIMKDNLSHEVVQAMLPAYLKGQLNSDLQRSIQEHISRCPECAFCQKEALVVGELLNTPPPSVEGLLTSQRRQSNLDTLLNQLDQQPAPQPPSRVRTFFERLRQIQVFSVSAALVTAQAIVIVFLLAGPLTTPAPDSPENKRYHTLSDSTGLLLSDRQVIETALEKGRLFRVLFNPSTSIQDVQSLLTGINAYIVSGPAAGGVYTVLIDADTSPSHSLTTMRNASEVVLVEQASYIDWQPR